MTRDNAKKLAASRMFLLAEDVDLIQQLVREQPAGILCVIDLGAGSGTTALAVLDERADTQITTIDISAENVAWAEKAVRNCYPHADWLGVVGDASEITPTRDNMDLIDLLLHDASHEREHVEADIRSWLPYLRPDTGRIWVHDVVAPPAAWNNPGYPGVAEAIVSLIGEGLIKPLGYGGLGWYGMRAK